MLQKAVEFDGRLCDLLMDSILEVRFASLEDQRQILLGAIAKLSADQISWKSAPDCWSVLQIVEHLVLCDERLGVAKRPQDIGTARPLFRVVPRRIRIMLLNYALNHNAKLPLPSAEIDPHGAIPMATLLERWQTVRELTRSELSSMSLKDRRYYHPILGATAATEMLDLDGVHIAYHARQIAGAMAAMKG